MQRRKFITLLGGAAAIWPLAARAQQPATPVVGFLHARSPEDVAYQISAFRAGLAETGYIENKNVTIQYRFARGQYGLLPEMAADLVGGGITVPAAGADPAATAAKAATQTIPIIFAVGSDPVKLGLVASVNRPVGNATGINILTSTLESKRLGLLHDLVPQTPLIGVLMNPNYGPAENQVRDIQEAAHAIGLQIHVLRSSTDPELASAFESIEQHRIGALIVAADPFLDTRRDRRGQWKRGGWRNCAMLVSGRTLRSSLNSGAGNAKRRQAGCFRARHGMSIRLSKLGFRDACLNPSME